jgi:hypothetical protein
MWQIFYPPNLCDSNGKRKMDKNSFQHWKSVVRTERSGSVRGAALSEAEV